MKKEVSPKKMDYYRKRFYAYFHYILETQGEESQEIMNEVAALYEDAYQSSNERRLRMLDRELTVEINEYPLEYRREINKRIEAEVGINAEDVEKKRLKKLQTIIKRGSIRNRDEYELVHSRLDELIHNVAKDDPARQDIPELERIFMDYSIALRPE